MLAAMKVKIPLLDVEIQRTARSTKLVTCSNEIEMNSDNSL